MQINITELEEFLEKANRNSYANKNAIKSDSLRPSSEDYHFEDGDLIYHDTYFGGRDFLGEEVVYKANKPVWGMNYYGFVLIPEVSEKDVYDFLREALMQEYEGIIPVRGPKEHKTDSRMYANASEGELGRFSGTEEILFNDKLIYRCWYHGGFIQ